jgi:hypothetical protein
VRRLTCFGLLLAGVAGCGTSESSKLSKQDSVSGKAATEATLQVIKSAEFERIVANHKGEVVVVDVWAEY